MLTAEYIPGTAGRLFCTLHLPDKPTDSHVPAVLVVPALCDEMNKTRQTLARIGHTLNQAGVALLIPDLYGTGDSEGDFRDASWQQWCDDVLTVVDHYAASGLRIRGMVTVRTGVLLAAAVMPRLPVAPLAATVWLQPVLNGDQFLTQMLRVRVLAKTVGEGVAEVLVCEETEP